MDGKNLLNKYLFLTLNLFQNNLSVNSIKVGWK